MTDEAIEGWWIMLGRDPGRLKRLEAKYTAYRGLDDSGTKEADGRGEYRGKRGRGGRRRGSGVASPASERGTQIPQRGKEAKRSRANHNRRDQRALKMARGGFSG
jgi:activating signal cointegrator complex subunit 2